VKDKQQQIDFDALTKSGVGAIVSGGLTAAIGWFVDNNILKNPEKLEFLTSRIADTEYGLKYGTFERMQAFTELDNPELAKAINLPKDAKIMLQSYKDEKQDILNTRTGLKISLLIGTAIVGIVIYQMVHQQNEKKARDDMFAENPENHINPDDANVTKITNNHLEHSQKKGSYYATLVMLDKAKLEFGFNFINQFTNLLQHTQNISRIEQICINLPVLAIGTACSN
jgi:hypothetical protein